MIRAAILALVGLLLLPTLAQTADIVGTASVIDGDTIDIHGPLSGCPASSGACQVRHLGTIL